ncbi:MAG: glycosyltransferase family 2 protein [Acidimicrobiales bacterium]
MRTGGSGIGTGGSGIGTGAAKAADEARGAEELGVAVVVPLYNGRDLIADCLSSVPEGVDIVVVDDASVDGAPELVERDFPGIKLLRNDRNLGFGSAANRGLRACTAEIRVVLNSDARLRPGALEHLREAFRDPEVGVAGPRLVFPDGTHQTSAARFHSVASIMAGAFVLNEVYRFLRPSGRFPFELGLVRRDHDIDQNVDWVLGACIAIRAACLDDIDGFDEGYYMYGEDMDLCWRAHQSAWTVRYVAGAVVEHLGGGSTGEPRLNARRMMRSEERFMARAHGPGALWRWRSARAVSAAMKIVVLAIPAMFDRRIRHRLLWQSSALWSVLRPGSSSPAR